MYFIVKIFTSALVIALVSELSKKSTFLAAFLVSLPLISIISFIWIYLDTKDLNRLSQMSYEVFWLVIPSLVFFLAFPYAIKQGLTFLAFPYAIKQGLTFLAFIGHFNADYRYFLWSNCLSSKTIIAKFPI